MRKDECEHGKRVGKAGTTVNDKLPFAGLFCPEKICEPVWLITKFKEVGERNA